MRVIFLIILFAQLFSGCQPQQQSAGKLTSILVPDKLSRQPPSTTIFFRKITYLPLETTKQSIIGNYPRVTVVDTFLPVYSSTGVLLFNAKNGKFIRKIGTKGRAPGEYNTATNVYDENKYTAYFMDHNYNLMEFDFSGQLLHTIEIPLAKRSKNIEKQSIAEIIYPLENNLYCAFFANKYGQEKKKIMIFDTSGTMLRLFPNHQFAEGYNFRNIGISFGGNGLFYQYKQNTFFKENYNDTIFQVTPHQLIPYARINFGKNQKPYTWQYEFRAEQIRKMDVHLRNPHAIITSINETKDQLYFWFYLEKQNYLGTYNKASHTVNTYNVQHGFVDDLNHFVPIHIHRFLPDGKAIGIINPPEITEWFETHKTDSLHPDILKLKNITLDDNPVITLLE